jgi:hypothetical protein
VALGLVRDLYDYVSDRGNHAAGFSQEEMARDEIMTFLYILEIVLANAIT